MNIKKIKNELEADFGKSISLKVYIGRNKYESFDGIINGIYPNIFTIKVNNEIKSFSYADILTSQVKINKK